MQRKGHSPEHGSRKMSFGNLALENVLWKPKEACDHKIAAKLHPLSALVVQTRAHSQAAPQTRKRTRKLSGSFTRTAWQTSKRTERYEVVWPTPPVDVP